MIKKVITIINSQLLLKVGVWFSFRVKSRLLVGMGVVEATGTGVVEAFCGTRVEVLNNETGVVEAFCGTGVVEVDGASVVDMF